MKRIPALAVLVLVCVACSDGTARPVDWLAYQADTTPPEIHVVRTDGTENSSPTSDVTGLDQTNPDWSPDGKSLVFGVTENGVDSLWTVHADGTGAAMLLECVEPCIFYDDPAWSPDGKKVAYDLMSVTDGVAIGALETVDVETGKVEVVMDGDEEHFFAGVRWSPDGSSLVFEYVHKTGPSIDGEVDGVELSVIDVATGAPSRRALTEPGTFAATADWGPYSDVIVFSALPTAEATAPDLFTIHPDGSGLTRMTSLGDDGGSAEEPAWSVDGKSVYFKARVAGEGAGLALVPAGGGEVKPAWGDTYPAGRHPRIHAAG
jgi:Tol biopolymer transport system component